MIRHFSTFKKSLVLGCSVSFVCQYIYYIFNIFTVYVGRKRENPKKKTFVTPITYMYTTVKCENLKPI